MKLTNLALLVATLSQGCSSSTQNYSIYIDNMRGEYKNYVSGDVCGVFLFNLETEQRVYAIDKRCDNLADEAGTLPPNPTSVYRNELSEAQRQSYDSVLRRARSAANL